MADERPSQQIMVVTPTGTGDSGQKTQVIATPHGQPDLVVSYVKPIVPILVRAGYAFFTALSGSVVAGESGAAHVEAWRTSLTFALGAALVSVVLNMVTIFSQLEKKYPIIGG